MPLFLQVKLLRVLQEGEIRPVGASSSKKVDVRIVSATSRDLAKEIASGGFREDLFYRINVFCVNVPPLRERMEDIPLLADHFLHKYSALLGKNDVRLSSAFLTSLLDYDWPGNVRELENCIERGLVLCEENVIDVECLPEKLRQQRGSSGSTGIPVDNLSLKRAAELLERDYICKALERTGGNRTHAAKILEISLRALLYKMKEYGLE